MTAGSAELDTLLESSWAGRSRAIRGLELRIEIVVTAVFAAAALLLVALGDTSAGVEPAAAVVVIAYAVAAQVEFPIGAACYVPTQLLLVPLFTVAAAPLVPLLVLVAFALAALVSAAVGRSALDRLAFCANDATHALGPALVFTVLSEGNAATASAGIVALAIAAQFAADFVSSSLHELVSMGAGPRVHAALLARVWSVDLALGATALPAAAVVVDGHPWAALAPVPLVLLLRAVAAERVRSADAAYERMVALKQERGRRLAAAELLDHQNAFLADVSHELRTPVTIARGHLEGVAGDTAAIALDELSRIERMIERLLMLASADRSSQPRERLDAETFLEDRFVRWSDSVNRPWRLADLAVGTLEVDTDAVTAALDALLENAVKHTTETQVVRLGSRAEDGVLAIDVIDGGSGIPEEALDRIFDRFGRADSARNREAGGCGLGLAIVDAVARAHDGSCSVRSSPEGTTFTLRLAGFVSGA